MKPTYRYYIHSMTDILVTDDFSIAYSIALDMADRENSFILLYDSVTGHCFHHIDELILYYDKGRCYNDLNENR